ncbi:MAG: hypothetical protein UMR38_08250 [Candidatus Izemoplasma sp.]|nr:hypothetical protein [Candidatus Izemoplasma sp.]
MAARYGVPKLLVIETTLTATITTASSIFIIFTIFTFFTFSKR